MTYLIEFSYSAEHREQIYRHLHEGDLTDTGVEVQGAWLAVQTGVAYVVVKAENGSDLYQACSRWADYGELKVTPLVAISEV